MRPVRPLATPVGWVLLARCAGRSFDTMRITIDPEFQSLIPPLAPEELAQLEANLIADGCRDPLVVWEAFSILLDGHNRHDICTRLHMPFETVGMEFADRSAAIEWIIRNQFGRRNLPAYVRGELALKLEAVIAGRARKQQGTRTDLPQNSAKGSPIDTRKEIAGIAGVSHDTIAKIKKLAALAPAPMKQQLRAGTMSINQAHTQIQRVEKEAKRESRREENRAKVAAAATPQNVVASGARFATIMIDPPWDWGDEGDQDQLGRARPDYATMSMAQLLELPLPALSDDDCHLYLWITNRSLPKGFALLEKWGFRYITAITWAKPSFGMGNYFRGQTEHVLFGVKGSQPLKRKDVGTLFEAPRGKDGHSSKPADFYNLVESCSPGPYLEMFSRANRDGWKAWGENS